MRLTQLLASALGVTEKAPLDASSMIAALLPGMTTTAPERGTVGMINAYNNSPWVRAITSRISVAVGSSSWQVYATKTAEAGRFYRDHRLQQCGIKRRDFKRRSFDVPEGVELVQLPEHPSLELLNGGSYRMPGSIGRQMTQLYLELTGEAFWLLEPRSIGGSVIPVGFWVIPPTWIKDVAQSSEGVFTIEGPSGRSVDVPAQFMLWFSNPNPVNPYGRGVGHLRAFGDEIDTDEFTSKYIRAFFYNSARPDLLVYGKDLQPADVQRLEIGWTQKVRGFLQAHKPFFLNRDVTVKELTYKFREMELIDLRKWERDILVNGRGLPPEVLGIIENSNRATIDAADYLFAKGVVEPALEFMRTVLQAELMPMYDERLVLGYDSPVEEDYDFQLRAMQAAPFAPTINEWRSMQGLDAIENGDQHVFNMTQTTVDLETEGGTPQPLPRSRALCGCKTHVSAAPGSLEAGRRGDMQVGASKAARIDPGVTVAKVGGPHNVDLATKLGKRMMGELLAAWEELKGSIDMKAFMAALQRGNLEAAIAIIDRVPFHDFLADSRETLREALYTVGEAAAAEVAEMLGADFSFQMISPEALQELEQFGAGMVTNVSDETMQAIRAALTDSYAEGRTAQETAKEIRSLIGLTERDARSAVRERTRLLESGMSEAAADAQMEKWIAKKIAQRAETIALNELVYAANRGQEMAWEAAKHAGLLDPKRVQRVWIGGFDENSCEVCSSASGTTAPIGGEFPNGFYTPNDAHVRCRCSEGLIWI